MAPGDRQDQLVDRAYQVGAAAAAPAPPAALSDRRGLIRALGIVQIAVGGVWGLGVLYIVVVSLSKGGLPPPGALLIWSLPALNLVLTGIGSVRMRLWARRATSTCASIWLGLLVLAAPAVMFGWVEGVGYEMFLATAMLLLAFALAIGLIVAYTRPSVRATFERRRTD